MSAELKKNRYHFILHLLIYIERYKSMAEKIYLKKKKVIGLSEECEK